MPGSFWALVSLRRRCSGEQLLSIKLIRHQLTHLLLFSNYCSCSKCLLKNVNSVWRNIPLVAAGGADWNHRWFVHQSLRIYICREAEAARHVSIWTNLLQLKCTCLVTQCPLETGTTGVRKHPRVLNDEISDVIFIYINKSLKLKVAWTETYMSGSLLQRVPCCAAMF